jgi:L-threonylcarbamoyladenylate synthase
MSRWHYQFAASVLRAGGVIAYPTEGVWGLGCDPYNERAVLRLLAMKQRPVSKGVILVAGSICQVEPFLGKVSIEQRQQLEQSWPGFQTWIIPVSGHVPDWLTGRHSSIAIRVSTHPQIQAICKYFDGPIVSTSANYAGRPAATTRIKVARYFNQQLDFVVPGRLGGMSHSSPISDVTTGAQIR